MLSSTSYNYDPLTLKQWILFFFIFFIVANISYSYSNECPSYNHFDTNLNETQAKNHLNKVFEYGEKTAGSLSLNKFTTSYIVDQIREIKSQKSPNVDVEFELNKSLESSFQIMGHITTYDKLYNIILTIKSKDALPETKYLLINCHYDTPPGSNGASDDFISCALMLEIARVLTKQQFALNYNILFLFNGAEEALLPASHAFITQNQLKDKIIGFINLEGAGAGGQSILFQSSPSRISNFLLDSFSRSSWAPKANVFAEELFQSGLIPGETDFRIFNHFGNIPGIDFAHIDDGYSYHTLHDVPNRISSQCLKLTGDNVLLMITDLLSTKGLEETPRLKNSTKEEKYSNKILASPHKFIENIWSKIFYIKDVFHYFYFDVFSLFIVRAPLIYLLLFNLVLSLFCIHFTLAKRRSPERGLFTPTRKGLYKAFKVQLALLISTTIFLICLAIFHIKIGLILAWFSWRVNMIFLYFIPLIGFQILFHYIVKRWFIEKSSDPGLNWIMTKKTDLNYTNIFNDFNDSSLLVLAMIMMIFSFFRLASSHILTQWIIFACFMPKLLLGIFNVPLLFRLLLILIPYGTTDYFMRISLLFKVFIPIAGRSGQTIPGDLPIAVITILVSVPFITTLSPGFISTKTCHLAKLLKIILVFYLGTVVFLKQTDFGFPYTSHNGREGILNGTSLTSQQRLVMFHMNKELHEDWSSLDRITSSESSIVITTLDGNGFKYLNISSRNGFFAPKRDTNKVDFPQDSLTRERCNFTQPYCGISYYYPFAFVFSNSMMYRDVKKHDSKPEIKFSVTNREVIGESCKKGPHDCWTSVKVSLLVQGGPPHTHMYIRTNPDFVRVSNFSFSDVSINPIDMPKPFKGETVGEHYFIYHLNGEATSDYAGPVNNPALWKSWVILTVKKSPNRENPQEHTFDLSLSGQYFDLDLPNSGTTNDLTRIIDKHIPDWFIITAYPTSYTMWKVSLVF